MYYNIICYKSHPLIISINLGHILRTVPRDCQSNTHHVVLTLVVIVRIRPPIVIFFLCFIFYRRLTTSWLLSLLSIFKWEASLLMITYTTNATSTWTFNELHTSMPNIITVTAYDYFLIGFQLRDVHLVVFNSFYFYCLSANTVYKIN